MFKPVSSKVNFPEMEKGVLQFWKDRGYIPPHRDGA